jgi:hypothetical protein
MEGWRLMLSNEVRARIDLDMRRAMVVAVHYDGYLSGFGEAERDEVRAYADAAHKRAREQFYPGAPECRWCEGATGFPGLAHGWARVRGRSVLLCEDCADRDGLTLEPFDACGVCWWPVFLGADGLCDPCRELPT